MPPDRNLRRLPLPRPYPAPAPAQIKSETIRNHTFTDNDNTVPLYSHYKVDVKPIAPPVVPTAIIALMD